MKKYKSRKGFSAVIVIIVILIIGGLGAGYYFFYDDYVAPLLNPHVKLIQKELRPYAMGKNAEAFIIIKNDREIKDAIIKSSPESGEQVNSFEGAIAVVNTTKLSGAIIILLDSPEKAAELKTLAESQKSTSPVTFTFEQKDKVLIASFGGGLEAMGGPLLENPAIKKLDPDMLDSQVVAYAAISQMGSLGEMINSSLSGMFSMPDLSAADNSILPVAHAQDSISSMNLFSAVALLPFIDDTTIYVRYKDMLFDIRVDIGFLKKSAIASAPLIKNAILKDGAVKIEDLEKTYDAAFSTITEMSGEMQKLLDEQTAENPGVTAKISYADLKLSLNINFSKDIAEKTAAGTLAGAGIFGVSMLPSTLGAPAKGRDAARKANLNALATAVEAYNLENGNYPEDSTCVDTWANMPDMLTYMQGGTPPVDPSGAQTFGSITCDGGYYYQSFGDAGYVLWAKTENSGDGNPYTSLNPEEFASEIYSGTMPEKETSGQYYVLNQISSVSMVKPPESSATASETPDESLTGEQTAPVKKVKRTP